MKNVLNILYIYSIALISAFTVYIFLSQFTVLNDLNFIAITGLTIYLLITTKNANINGRYKRSIKR
jgi:hypothetical protein